MWRVLWPYIEVRYWNGTYLWSYSLLPYLAWGMSKQSFPITSVLLKNNKYLAWFIVCRFVFYVKAPRNIFSCSSISLWQTIVNAFFFCNFTISFHLDTLSSLVFLLCSISYNSLDSKTSGGPPDENCLSDFRNLIISFSHSSRIVGSSLIWSSLLTIVCVLT